MISDKNVTFRDKNNPKNKYHFKIFDLDNYDIDEAVKEANNLIREWHGGKYRPNININICSNDDIIFKSSILNGIKDGISKIVSSSYPFITTSKIQNKFVKSVFIFKIYNYFFLIRWFK